MNLIYLKKFNNYYNRRVKFYENLQDYLDNSEDYFYNAAVDFNPNDGVSTVKTMNLDNPSFLYDYLLVQDELSKSIISRWFVMEAKRERNGQYTIILRRDVIADNFNSIIKSPVFIHKAKLQADNPLIYNKENMLVNQIKKSETLLKDETDSAWIVGYLAPNAISEDGQTFSSIEQAREFITLEAIPLQFNDVNDPTAGATGNVLGDVFFEAIASPYGTSSNLQFKKVIASYANGLIYGHDVADCPGMNKVVYNQCNNLDAVAQAWSDSFNFSLTGIDKAISNHMDGINRPMMSNEMYLDITQLNRPIYSTKYNKYYKINILTNVQQYQSDPLDGANFYEYDSALSALYKTVVNKSKTYLENDKLMWYNDNGNYFISYFYRKLTISILEVDAPDDILQTTILPNHKTTVDSPYDIFCLKFSDINLNLATSIQRILTSQKLYDIQILPYCPKREIINNIEFGDEGVDYNRITKNGETVDYIYWCQNSSFSFTLPYNYEVNLNNPIEVKVVNECDFHRIVSPNYNGAYEFNVAKNKGLTGFNVACTYKPYTPFIYVAPIFGGLYGSDYYDGRGLICQGNFSITQLSDAWQNYEIQNKNYMNIFNTQIKTMDANRNLMLGSEIAVSSLQAISSAIGTGMSSGSAGKGLVVGGLSAIGGAIDIAIGQSMFQNNRQQSIDLFRMNLQNIKARPDTLTNVSAYNIINKYFPFLEYYSCTDEEKEALRNKIKYEGMTVNAIGTIEDYLSSSDEYNYFKGSTIILEDVADDYHTTDAITVELEKGVYL